MVVREVISDLERANPDWSRNDLLDILNKCYRILMWHPSEFTRAIGTDGLDPEITPTTNTYTVEDAYQILRVYASYGVDGRQREPVHSRTIGTVKGNVIHFTNAEVGNTFRIMYYQKTDDYTVESEELIFPEEKVDTHLITLCNERIAYAEHQSLQEWKIAKDALTKEFRYYLNKYQAPSHLNDRNTVSRDSYFFNRNRYGSRNTYGRYY